jgi:glycerol uptake facilitator-like aquaporin
LKSSDDNVITHAAFAHGLTIFVLVSSLGHISGGHFNPAVTFAVSLAGKMNPLLIIPYWIAQLTGGLTGALLVKVGTFTRFNPVWDRVSDLKPTGGNQ